MKLVTQDGRTLKVSRNFKVEIEAGQYVGHVNICFVEARLRPRFAPKCRIEVTLGEYPTWEEASAVRGELRQALAESKPEFVMQGNEGLAPQDNLMTSIILAIEAFEPSGCLLEFGMINGESNDRYGLNPDENGSYTTSLAKRGILLRATA